MPFCENKWIQFQSTNKWSLPMRILYIQPYLEPLKDLPAFLFWIKNLTFLLPQTVQLTMYCSTRSPKRVWMAGIETFSSKDCFNIISEHCFGYTSFQCRLRMKQPLSCLPFFQSCWPTRDHIGRSTGISNPAWHLPQVVSRVHQTIGFVHAPSLHCPIANSASTQSQQPV